jgi:hypothetical protein
VNPTASEALAVYLVSSSDVQIRQLMEDLHQLMKDRRSSMAQVHQIRTKRKKSRQKYSRAPKSVKVRQICVQLRQKSSIGQTGPLD